MMLKKFAHEAPQRGLPFAEPLPPLNFEVRVVVDDEVGLAGADLVVRENERPKVLPSLLILQRRQEEQRKKFERTWGDERQRFLRAREGFERFAGTERIALVGSLHVGKQDETGWRRPEFSSPVIFLQREPLGAPVIRLGDSPTFQDTRAPMEEVRVFMGMSYGVESGIFQSATGVYETEQKAPEQQAVRKYDRQVSIKQAKKQVLKTLRDRWAYQVSIKMMESDAPTAFAPKILTAENGWGEVERREIMAPNGRVIYKGEPRGEATTRMIKEGPTTVCRKNAGVTTEMKGVIGERMPLTARIVREGRGMGMWSEGGRPEGYWEDMFGCTYTQEEVDMIVATSPWWLGGPGLVYLSMLENKVIDTVLDIVGLGDLKSILPPLCVVWYNSSYRRQI